MKAMIGFLRTMLTFPKPWVAWIILVMMSNMILSVIFLGTP